MEHLTLYELNNFVRKVLEINLSETYWLQAELSEVKENRGHCFVEFVQKAKKNNSIIAKARGQIWASKWAIMRPYFEQTQDSGFRQAWKCWWRWKSLSMKHTATRSTSST
jgi:exodeoxyribonuclease VII large subunit